MSRDIDIEDVMRTANVFEKSKTAKAAAEQLGIVVRTLYNRIGKLEEILGTVELKRQYPRCFAAKHSARGPKRQNIEDVETPFIEPATAEQIKAMVKSETGKPVTTKTITAMPKVTVAKNEKNTLAEIRRRINTKAIAKNFPTTSYNEEQLRAKVSTGLAQVLYYIDATTLGKAKLSELSQMFKTLFEAQQLLDGKPTTILSRGDKDQLKSLIPRLLQEAKRRGISLHKVKTVEGEEVENG